VQIIEQTGFGVRSAVLTLESPAHQARFIVFPMLHLAMPSFYQAVRRGLQDCDQIVVEGVAGNRTRLMTLAYRTAGRLGRGGLVDQGTGLDLSAFADRLVRPDMTAAEFASGWRRVSRGLRWTVLLLTPAIGVWMAVVGPRRALGSNVAVDQEPTREEEEMADATETWDQLIVDERDRALCAALVRLAAEASEPRTVGVCWGAQHVRAVVRVLMGDLGYRIVDATWVTVMD